MPVDADYGVIAINAEEWHAVCDCGWRSSTFHFRPNADRALIRHEVVTHKRQVGDLKNAPRARPAPLLSTQELADRSGATFRQLEYWGRIGLLIPCNEVTGSGNPRRYRPDDVARAERLARLSAAIRPSGSSGLFRYVAARPFEPWWVYQDGPLVITVEWDDP
jgi:hypothetical protein